MTTTYDVPRPARRTVRRQWRLFLRRGLTTETRTALALALVAVLITVAVTLWPDRTPFTALMLPLIVAKLGPDPLRPDADPDRAWARITKSPRAIGDLLMDQAVLAGVGNVYRAEVLFRHRIHPLRPGNTLRVGQWQAIWDDLVVLMAEGVRTGRIDTVRPEHTPEAMGRPPRKDDHGGEVYVYRRNGQPCHVCGRLVRTVELQGRNLFWCAHCQRRFRSRALQSSALE